MYLEPFGGDYVMKNLVTAFEQDRTIAWEPGLHKEGAEFAPVGHWWRYDLEPVKGGTRVTMTYDWSKIPPSFREIMVGVPPFAPSYLDESLATLDHTVTGA